MKVEILSGEGEEELWSYHCVLCWPCELGQITTGLILLSPGAKWRYFPSAYLSDDYEEPKKKICDKNHSLVSHLHRHCAVRTLKPFSAVDASTVIQF